MVSINNHIERTQERASWYQERKGSEQCSWLREEGGGWGGGYRAHWDFHDTFHIKFAIISPVMTKSHLMRCHTVSHKA